MALAMEIQNQGVNHAFFEYSGHVDTVYLRVFDGFWKRDINEVPIYDRYAYADIENLTKIASDLRLILEKGVQALPDYQDRKAKEREAKIKQFEALKAELGKEAA